VEKERVLRTEPIPQKLAVNAEEGGTSVTCSVAIVTAKSRPGLGPEGGGKEATPGGRVGSPSAL